MKTNQVKARSNSDSDHIVDRDSLGFAQSISEIRPHLPAAMGRAAVRGLLGGNKVLSLAVATGMALPSLQQDQLQDTENFSQLASLPGSETRSSRNVEHFGWELSLSSGSPCHIQLLFPSVSSTGFSLNVLNLNC